MNLSDVYQTTKEETEYKRTCIHMEYVREYWDEVSAIKELIANNQEEAARRVFNDLTESVRIGLWRATTKGGCWTIDERKALKPNEVTP